MPNEREVINLTNKSKVDLSNKTEHLARLAKILDRGMISDRLHVTLPDDKYGEWVHNDPVEINRMQAMGFDEDREYAVKNSMHTDATGRAVVGDVVFMVAPMWVKEAIDAHAAKRYEQAHGKKKTEEEKFAMLTNQQGFPVVNKSNSNVVDGKDIAMTAHITQ